MPSERRPSPGSNSTETAFAADPASPRCVGSAPDPHRSRRPAAPDARWPSSRLREPGRELQRRRPSAWRRKLEGWNLKTSKACRSSQTRPVKAVVQIQYPQAIPAPTSTHLSVVFHHAVVYFLNKSNTRLVGDTPSKNGLRTAAGGHRATEGTQPKPV